MSGASDHQRQIANRFELRPILYIPGLAHLFGVNEAILLSQLLYWDGKGQYENWTYKTIPEFQKETGLTRNRQDSAIQHLVKLGVLEVTHHRTPRTRHFRVDMDRLHELITSLLESGTLEHLNPPSKSAEKPPTITEITHDTTPENTLSYVKKDFDTLEVFDTFFTSNTDKTSYDMN